MKAKSRKSSTRVGNGDQVYLSSSRRCKRSDHDIRAKDRKVAELISSTQKRKIGKQHFCLYLPCNLNFIIQCLSRDKFKEGTNSDNCLKTYSLKFCNLKCYFNFFLTVC